MKKINYTNWIGAIAVALLVAACSGASKDKQTQLNELREQQANISKQIAALEKELATENPDQVVGKAKDVSLTQVQAQPFNHYIQTQGQIEAEDNIMVSAKSMGVIVQVIVKEGQQVGKGQTLAQIDNTLILSNIESMKTQLELAKTVYERQKNLWDQKIGTEVQFLQAKTNKESLEKQLEMLKEQNEMTRIKSPISGTVDKVFVKTGENIAPGMPAARVVNTSDLKLAANVSEAFVTNVRPGNKAIVTIPELKKDIEAKVTFVGRTIDPLSRTFSIEVQLPSHPDLRPNMTGVVKVVYHTESAAVVVPINVVQTVNDEKVVFVAEESGNNMVAKRRVVTLGGVFNNLAQIDSGLKAGERVITFGYQGLSDGELIKM
ncbi:MAG: efflux RND transporter periplasmic adaptor subunit [Cyclobacteriaceae bacterium]